MNGTVSLDCPPVIVIGAGVSGLTAIKSCLEEELNVVCFEKTSDIGGLWRFTEEVTDGLASVMRSTVINSSKEMSCYSDFPPPAEFANFMHHTSMVKYLELYAAKFDLRRHIRFRHNVLSVSQKEDFATSGQWNVLVRNMENGEETTLTASGIMVCSGHHSTPCIPKFPGLDLFKGKVIHTHAYKDFKSFEDKRVVVVGIGNSGGDVAVELSRISSKVYLSTRRGTWVVNRVGTMGLPIDYAHLRRFLTGYNAIIPASWFQFFAELLLTFRFDHKLYNVKPTHRLFAQHVMINDSLPNCIISGTVVIKNDVVRFTENGVVFKGEEDKEYKIDAVILATGYHIHFPFIDPKILTVKDNRVHLYKNMFEPQIQPPTLAVIGLIQPLGSIAPISEMQSRLTARAYCGKQALPSFEEMEKDIERLRIESERKYVQTPRHTIQVEYMTYIDDVAELIDAKPSLWKVALSDPVLWLYCFLGPNVPYQYRLQGPHRWSGARDAIIKCGDRVRAPLQTRREPKKSAESYSLNSYPTNLQGLRAYILMAFGALVLALCFSLSY